MRRLLSLLLLAPGLTVAQQPEPAEVGFGPDPSTPVESVAQPLPAASRGAFDNLRLDADAFTLVGQSGGLSFHKPMYAMPLTWSQDYDKETTEVLFQISLKQRLFKRNIFFGYSQRSFWQLYNGNDSRPFRETNYNPELFYRWKPKWVHAPGLGFDLGVDHESNGKTLPDSRSWNRILGAAWYETPDLLAHLRLWYRVPEDEGRDANDPKRDDNPDIADYYGYGELRLQKKLAGDAKHRLSLMLRGNTVTGKGAIEAVYSVPASDYAYWNIYIWNGYGEGLADYNRSITRVGIGYMLSR
ncbi:MAG: phospholipase A [Hydrocarboniphaga effusa]|nr:phospholipase A [Hydrocarboniphaga effusa]